MGDFNGANLCDSDLDAVLFINISPYKRTNHALTPPSDIGVGLNLMLALVSRSWL